MLQFTLLFRVSLLSVPVEVRDSSPNSHVGPSLQPAQAGRFRVRVPSPAPPTASFFLSQLRSSSEKGGSVIVTI